MGGTGFHWVVLDLDAGALTTSLWTGFGRKLFNVFLVTCEVVGSMMERSVGEAAW